MFRYADTWEKTVQRQAQTPILCTNVPAHVTSGDDIQVLLGDAIYVSHVLDICLDFTNEPRLLIGI